MSRNTANGEAKNGTAPTLLGEGNVCRIIARLPTDLTVTQETAADEHRP